MSNPFGNDITADDIVADPALRTLLKEIGQYFKEGKLTLAEIGGFTDQELDGAYAVVLAPGVPRWG